MNGRYDAIDPYAMEETFGRRGPLWYWQWNSIYIQQYSQVIPSQK